MGNSGCGVSRRQFVGSVCPFVLGGLSLPLVPLVSGQQDRPGFWDEFAPAEREAVEGSIMAQSVPGYIGQGYGCAEICLAAAVDYLGEPSEWVNAAAVFSGGLGQRDLCGFLTGGMMAVGVAAGKLHEERTAKRDFARPRGQEYWDWWVSRGPIHCSELRALYDGSEQFMRMAQRVTAKVEQLIAPAAERP